MQIVGIHNRIDNVFIKFVVFFHIQDILQVKLFFQLLQERIFSRSLFENLFVSGARFLAIVATVNIHPYTVAKLGGNLIVQAIEIQHAILWQQLTGRFDGTRRTNVAANTAIGRAFTLDRRLVV